MKTRIMNIFSYISDILKDIHFDMWVYFRHRDESYYECGDNQSNYYTDFIESNVDYLRMSVDHVLDEYFYIPEFFDQKIESIRLRRYINNEEENRIFMIVKLPDNIINDNLIREVIVFIFREDKVVNELYERIKNIIYKNFKVESSFVIDKQRSKYTLFEELHTIDNHQQGSSLRITVDKINRVIDISKNKDLTNLLPSTLIIEFERPYYGWSEQAEQQYSEVTSRIIGVMKKNDILRKNKSKFCNIIQF
ncbi:hypothetical protein [Xenorhabdus sp. KK7.4]|uniref:hypothetical protein n=1 Tax=Xenorhabdus sp. KK7.4 TaxID=1851572 RepID=UPI000C04A672|nr:hypothetical protein [Xenorhabdus sp. KK7.4]PHM58693.1 hypothetical protein Xekk_01268 [Xenorhabdus sp. KK7.4]